MAVAEQNQVHNNRRTKRADGQRQTYLQTYLPPSTVRVGWGHKNVKTGTFAAHQNLNKYSACKKPSPWQKDPV